MVFELNYTSCVESDITVHYAVWYNIGIFKMKLWDLIYFLKVILNLLLTSASQYRSYREHGWPDHIPLCVIEWGGGVYLFIHRRELSFSWRKRHDILLS